MSGVGAYEGKSYSTIGVYTQLLPPAHSIIVDAKWASHPAAERGVGRAKKFWVYSYK